MLLPGLGGPGPSATMHLTQEEASRASDELEEWIIDAAENLMSKETTTSFGGSIEHDERAKGKIGDEDGASNVSTDSNSTVKQL